MAKYGNYGFLNTEQMTSPPLLLLDFGLERRQNEKYDFDNAGRDYDGYLFQYTLKGCGAFEKEGSFHPLRPGTAFFAHIPEQSRYYLPLRGVHPVENDFFTGENCWEYLYVHFQGQAAQPFFEEILAHHGPCLSLSRDSFPIQLWLNLHADMGNGRQLRPYEGGELVYRFLASLLRTLESPANPVLSPRVEEGIRYMKEHLAEHFSMEELSGQLGLSSAYFTRLFTKETGQAPLSWLTRQRLSHSLFLLLNTSLTVEEVATSCGFSCGNYFCKVFRRATGLSPADYRRRYNG